LFNNSAFVKNTILLLTFCKKIYNSSISNKKDKKNDTKSYKHFISISPYD